MAFLRFDVIFVFNSLSLGPESLACLASFRLNSRTRCSFPLDFTRVASRRRASTFDALVGLNPGFGLVHVLPFSLAPWSIPDWHREDSGFPLRLSLAVGVYNIYDVR